jgi:hypothetical protein
MTRALAMAMAFAVTALVAPAAQCNGVPPAVSGTPD